MPTNDAFCISLQVVLGVLCFGFFQISGGNPRFVEFSDGLSAMARLAFGYLDWDAFYNEATGRTRLYAQEGFGYYVINNWVWVVLQYCVDPTSEAEYSS